MRKMKKILLAVISLLPVLAYGQSMKIDPKQIEAGADGNVIITRNGVNMLDNIDWSDINNVPTDLERTSNKVTNLNIPDNTTYPTTKAVSNALSGKVSTANSPSNTLNQGAVDVDTLFGSRFAIVNNSSTNTPSAHWFHIIQSNFNNNSLSNTFRLFGAPDVNDAFYYQRGSWGSNPIGPYYRVASREWVTAQNYLTAETDPVYTADKPNIIFSGDNNSLLNNDAGYITSTAIPNPQTLSLSGHDLSLSGGGGTVTIPDNNTTYTAGNGINLSGTTFSATRTTTGTGSVVTDVTQTTNGYQVKYGDVPTPDLQQVTDVDSTTDHTIIAKAIWINDSTGNTPGGYHAGVIVDRNINPDEGSEVSHGVRDQSSFDGTNTTGYAAFDFRPQIKGDMAHADALQFYPYLSAGTDVGDLEAVDTKLWHWDAGAWTPGQVKTFTGLRVESAAVIANAGRYNVVDTSYGVRIQGRATDGIGATNPYSFWSGGSDKLYNNGNAAFGTYPKDDGIKLKVKGATKLDGTLTLTSAAGTGIRMMVANADGDVSTQAIPSSPTNYMTTNTNQTGLTGNKSSSGTWDFRLKHNDWYLDEDGAQRIYVGNGSGANLGLIFKNATATDMFQFRSTSNSPVVTIDNSGNITSDALEGTGTRMVTANTNGQLGTQAIPANTNIGNSNLTIPASTVRQLTLGSSSTTQLRIGDNFTSPTSYFALGGGQGIISATTLILGNDIINKYGTFNFGSLTTGRTYSWPNKNGTVAMTSDIAGTNLGGSYNSSTGNLTLTSSTGTGTTINIPNGLNVPLEDVLTNGNDDGGVGIHFTGASGAQTDVGYFGNPDFKISSNTGINMVSDGALALGSTSDAVSIDGATGTSISSPKIELTGNIRKGYKYLSANYTIPTDDPYSIYYYSGAITITLPTPSSLNDRAIINLVSRSSSSATISPGYYPYGSSTLSTAAKSVKIQCANINGTWGWYQIGGLP